MRIAIVSDVRLYREGLEIALARDSRLELVGGISAIELLSLTLDSLKPEILIADISIVNSLEKIKLFIRRHPKVKVIALTVDENEQQVISCAEAGVAGYVCRDDSLEDLLNAIKQTFAGSLHCSSKYADCLFRRVAELAADKKNQEPFQSLTPREKRILELIRKGFTNKAIAKELSIQIATVKNHVHSILSKLNVKRRGQAAALVT